MQKKIRKYCDLDKAINLVNYAKSKNLTVRCFYILGFPEESVQNMQRTIDYALKVRADWSTFSVAVPLPGSEMYQQFVDLGYIKNLPEFWGTATQRDRVFDTAEISAKEVQKLAQEANLKVNFVHNPMIEDGKFAEAEAIFKKFIQLFDFHVFAYDALRRIYSKTGRKSQAGGLCIKVKKLLNENKQSAEFNTFLYLLDDEIREFLAQ